MFVRMCLRERVYVFVSVCTCEREYLCAHACVWMQVCVSEGVCVEVRSELQEEVLSMSIHGFR